MLEARDNCHCEFDLCNALTSGVTSRHHLHLLSMLLPLLLLPGWVLLQALAHELKGAVKSGPHMLVQQLDLEL